MAINRQDTNIEGITSLNEGLFMRLVEQIRTHARAGLLAVGIGAAGVSGAMADESKVQLAQADITPVAMTDVTPEAAGEHQTITRETLKGFMDERLHELIDNLSDDALAYLSPIIESAQSTIANERYRNSFITGMIGVFLQPDLSDFNQGIERFARAGLVVDEDVVNTARTYIGAKQDSLDLERGEIVLALATQREIIERQRERISELDMIIQRLQVQSADLQAQSADLQVQSAEIQARRAVILADIERLRNLRGSVEQMILYIEEQSARQPA